VSTKRVSNPFFVLAIRGWLCRLIHIRNSESYLNFDFEIEFSCNWAWL